MAAAWTADRWPLDAGSSTPTNLLTCANELRTQLNARAGCGDAGWVDITAFAEGQSTWDAIKLLRDGVDSVVTDFYKDSDWGQYVGNGVAGDGGGIGGTLNIFLDLFGGTRNTWLNAPATQATAAAYDPTDGDLPYKTYLNELYTVIDALEWKRVICSLYTDTNSKSALEREGGQEEGVDAGAASAQAAIDAAWTAATGDTAAAVAGPDMTMEIAYERWVGA